MYIHMNSSGGISLGGAIGGLLGFGDSFQFGNNNLYFPKDDRHFVHFETREEYEEAIRQGDIHDGLKLAIYGTGSVCLGIAAAKAEEQSKKITTAMSSAVCGIYALGSGYAIIQRHRRYAEYLENLKKEKKTETKE